MKKSQFLVGFVAVLGLLVIGLRAADKVKTDKERIVALEKQVDELTEVVAAQETDLEGAHKWAEAVNKELEFLLNRGPVAKLQ